MLSHGLDREVLWWSEGPSRLKLHGLDFRFAMPVALPIQARRRNLDHVLENESLYRGPADLLYGSLVQRLVLLATLLAVHEVSSVTHVALRDGVDVEGIVDIQAIHEGNEILGELQREDAAERPIQFLAVLARIQVARVFCPASPFEIWGPRQSGPGVHYLNALIILIMIITITIIIILIIIVIIIIIIVIIITIIILIIHIMS